MNSSNSFLHTLLLLLLFLSAGVVNAQTETPDDDDSFFSSIEHGVTSGVSIGSYQFKYKPIGVSADIGYYVLTNAGRRWNFSLEGRLAYNMRNGGMCTMRW